MKEMAKKNKELIIAIAVVLILIITGTYAWLTLTRESEQVNVIRAGSLSMELDESASEGIALINAVPMSYQQGILTDKYTFTLNNESPIANEYSIILEDQLTYTNDEGEEVTIDSTNRLGDNKIRFVLLKDGEVATPEKSHLLSEDPGRIIDTGVIDGDASVTYTLIMWIDSRAQNAQDETETEEVMGKVFNAKLRIEAEQAQ